MLFRTFLNEWEVNSHFCDFVWGIEFSDGEGEVIISDDALRVEGFSVIVLHNLLLINAFLWFAINTDYQAHKLLLKF